MIVQLMEMVLAPLAATQTSSHLQAILYGAQALSLLFSNIMNYTQLQSVKTSAQRFVVLAHGKDDIFCRRCMIRAGMVPK